MSRARGAELRPVRIAASFLILGRNSRPPKSRRSMEEEKRERKKAGCATRLR